MTPDLRFATELVVGNLNETGYLTASDEELAEALLQFKTPSRTEPIPFERGAKNRSVALRLEPEVAGEQYAAEPIDLAATTDDATVEALEIVRQARTIVNHLDPVGVGARDLRECLLIQIEAQRSEAEMVLGRRQKGLANRNGAVSSSVGSSETYSGGSLNAAVRA